MHSDSIEGIYDTLKQCALISKSAGGIGLNVHCIRATGSYIAGVRNFITLCAVFYSTEGDCDCTKYVEQLIFKLHEHL